ncbi:MAG: hypothetical protein AB2375_08770 [Tissierellaceae bacterium]
MGIIVTTILSIVIYHSETITKKKAEEDKIRMTKSSLELLLYNGTLKALECSNSKDWIEMDNFNFTLVTDKNIDLITDIRHLMNQDQYLYINELFKTLKDMSDLEKSEDYWESRKACEKYIGLITLPVYLLYRHIIKDYSSIYDILNKEAIEIFNILSIEDNKQKFFYGIRYNRRKKILFEVLEGYRFKVYDELGNIICDAIFNEDGIIGGRAKIFDEEGFLIYDGSYVGGKRCGQGIEYLFNGRKGKEGEWKDNQLVDGVIYDVILDSSNRVFAGSIRQIKHSFDLNNLKENPSAFRVGNIRVKDGQNKVIKKSIKTIPDFIKRGR